jgi:hypothetical protein
MVSTLVKDAEGSRGILPATHQALGGPCSVGACLKVARDTAPRKLVVTKRYIFRQQMFCAPLELKGWKRGETLLIVTHGGIIQPSGKHLGAK